MTEPNDKLVEELVEELARVMLSATFSDGDTLQDYLGMMSDGDGGIRDATVIAHAILPILTRDTLAAYQRGLRDATAICDEVAMDTAHLRVEKGASIAAQRIRKRMS